MRRPLCVGRATCIVPTLFLCLKPSYNLAAPRERPASSHVKMKKIFGLFLFVLLSHGKAIAGDFSFGITSQGANFWTAITQAPVFLIDNILGAGASGFTYEWISIEDSQGKIKVDKGNYFGFKAKDIFNNFGYGLTFGYQPKFSPLGIFVNGGYKFRQFRMQPDRGLEGMEKYKLNSWSAGATLRVTPLIGMYMDEGWSPIAEIGTNYNQVFKCKAPYERDKDQFGKGFSTRLALGVRICYDDYDDRGMSISLSYEIPHYDYFNRDFVAADGSMPYADIKSKNHSVSLRLQLEF
ncbi:MAG: hypothetical protein PARBB_00302 [Parabacteroides distasonis]